MPAMRRSPLTPPENREKEEDKTLCVEKEEREQELDRLRTILFSGSVEEHRQTFDFLKRAVDEARPSNRKFFP